MARPTKNAKITRRQFLVYRALERGASPAQAEAHANSEAAKHPEWNMGDKKSWDDWTYYRERGW